MSTPENITVIEQADLYHIASKELYNTLSFKLKVGVPTFQLMSDDTIQVMVRDDQTKEGVWVEITEILKKYSDESIKRWQDEFLSPFTSKEEKFELASNIVSEERFRDNEIPEIPALLREGFNKLIQKKEAAPAELEDMLAKLRSKPATENVTVTSGGKGRLRGAIEKMLDAIGIR